MSHCHDSDIVYVFSKSEELVDHTSNPWEPAGLKCELFVNELGHLGLARRHRDMDTTKPEI